MHDSATRVFTANLDRLSAATRAAITASGHADVRAEPPHFRLEVSTPAGAWVPMFPSGDPMAAARALLAKLSVEGPPPLVLIAGLGAGYLLDVLEAAGNTTTKILAIEPVPAMTRVLLMRRDCTAWLATGRLTILAGPEYAGAAEAWRVFGPDMEKPPTIITPLVTQHFPEAAAQATRVMRQIIGGVQANAEARRQFAGRYLLNTLRNVPTIVNEGDTASLAGLFAGTPAIVIAAGPSLDRNLAAIKAVADRAVLIAVDTALRPLVAAGVRPHVVVSVDPSELNAKHLHQLPPVGEVWFVAEPSLDPSVFPAFATRTFTFHVSDHHPWPWLAEHGVRRGALRAWGSVLTTAFDLASVMGCAPVVFAGADLAFSRGLQYCRNTTYEPAWADCADDEARAERFKTYLATRSHQDAPDVHGRSVVTTPPYLQFRDWIVARAGEMADVPVWNATGDGILYGGRIEQVDDLAARLADAPRVIDAHGQLRARWGQRPTPAIAGARLHAALTEGRSLPLVEWRAFGGERLSADALDQALTGAVGALHGHARAMAMIDLARARTNAAAVTREAAEALMHPRYALATAQAPAQLAHVVLELAERTFDLERGRSMRDVVAAAGGVVNGLRALDVGCGLGRTMVPLAESGFQVDGVDISEPLIAFARQDARLAGSSFFVSSGVDCGAAPIDAYDLVYALHTFPHLRSRVARLALLDAMVRVLRPGGVLVVQLPFFPDARPATVMPPNVAWSHDVSESVDGLDAPGGVQCTPDDLPVLYRDFSRSLRDVTVRIVDLPPRMRPGGRAAQPRSSHAIVSGSRGYTLAPRMYEL